jgi:K+-transporting ATPase ATPase C chain
MGTLKQEIRGALVAIVILTALLGLAYPLAITGVAETFFKHQAGGSFVNRGGRTVGSSLIGQSFRSPRYFHSRPSVTEYNPSGTAFSNLGPNSRELSRTIAGRLRAYLRTEGRFTQKLEASAIPPDAVTASASSVDPEISVANARIQANRVAAVRGLPLSRVLDLVSSNTDNRDLGVLGEAGVNVLELNLDLDRAGADR